jgi:hypothetical protein
MLAQFDASRTVYLLADYLDLLSDGEVEVVEESKGRFSFASCNDCLGKGTCTSTTFCPMVAHYRSISTGSESLLTDELKFSTGIRAVQKSARIHV